MDTHRSAAVRALLQTRAWGARRAGLVALAGLAVTACDQAVTGSQPGPGFEVRSDTGGTTDAASELDRSDALGTASQADAASEPGPEVAACQPQCGNRICGNEPACNSSCGTCFPGAPMCTPLGQCVQCMGDADCGDPTRNLCNPLSASCEARPYWATLTFTNASGTRTTYDQLSDSTVVSYTPGEDRFYFSAYLNGSQVILAITVRAGAQVGVAYPLAAKDPVEVWFSRSAGDGSAQAGTATMTALDRWKGGHFAGTASGTLPGNDAFTLEFAGTTN